MHTPEPAVPGVGHLNELLIELRQAGEVPDRALLDRIKAHGEATVPALIEMALDETLHHAPSDSPAIWAPLHAIQLLGEIGAPRAIEPLLSLVDWIDDDYLGQILPAAFGGIGAPAVAPLRALLFDRGRNVWARGRAADSLSKIGQGHPEVRSEVLSALVTCLGRDKAQGPDDRILNALAVCELLALKAVEAAPAIRQAFREDRVDTSIVDFDYALDELGLSPERPVRARQLAWPGPEQPIHAQGPGATTPRRAVKIGRNAPCPCGSGKKYKKCHGR
jgi:hypothetical protein